MRVDTNWNLEYLLDAAIDTPFHRGSEIQCLEVAGYLLRYGLVRVRDSVLRSVWETACGQRPWQQPSPHYYSTNDNSQFHADPQLLVLFEENCSIIGRLRELLGDLEVDQHPELVSMLEDAKERRLKRTGEWEQYVCEQMTACVSRGVSSEQGDVADSHAYSMAVTAHETMKLVLAGDW